MNLSEIHLFTTGYGYGWGTMVVIASTVENAVIMFIERMRKEACDDDDLDGYVYLGTMERFGRTFYHYDGE